MQFNLTVQNLQMQGVYSILHWFMSLMKGCLDLFQSRFAASDTKKIRKGQSKSNCLDKESSVFTQLCLNGTSDK